MRCYVHKSQAIGHRGQPKVVQQQTGSRVLFRKGLGARHRQRHVLGLAGLV